MKVSDIMTTNMIVVNKDDSILEVAKLMKNHNIGCIPVIDEGNKVLGVITDRDIVMNMAKFNADPANTCAKEITSNVVYKVKPDADVKIALDLMEKQKVRRLPVLENEKLVGIISLGDIAVRTRRNMEVGDALIEISKPSKVENV